MEQVWLVPMNSASSQHSDKRIALVVPCTKRKHGLVAPEMHFRTLGRMNVRLLASEWIRRADSADGHRTADRLYSGAGWVRAQTACSLVQQKLGTPYLYVLSAGFGLLRASDLLPPYSATFAAEEDQVARHVEGSASPTQAHREWWQAINHARSGSVASTLDELTAHDLVLIAASSEYVKAIVDDLTSLAKSYGPGRLFLIAIGQSRTDLDTTVQQCLLPVDISIEMMLPGPRSTINQRTLEWIVGKVVPQVSWDRKSIESYISKELETYQLARASLPKRELHKMDNAAIRQWIRSCLDQRPDMPKHRLLRMFRASHSCEQSRFYELVAAVRREIEGAMPLWR